MTYKEAKEQGYKDIYQRYQRGYVSRKINTDDQPVLKSGRNGKGPEYVLLPAGRTTRFCVRQYIRK